MRFKLATSIMLFASLLLNAQTKIFVKFNNIVKPREVKEVFSSSLQNSLLLKSSNLNNFSSKSFYERFGHLSESLDRVITVTVPKGTDVDDFISTLMLNNKIEFVSKSLKLKIDGYRPSDSLYSEQWGLRSVHAAEAWNFFENDTTKILLALIDTGIDYEHPDLKNVIYINRGETGIDKNGNDKSTNGIDDDNNGYIDDYRGWDFVNKPDVFGGTIKDDFTEWDNDPFDENRHGTLVAGIIAAEHNSIGIAGVSQNIKILNLRAFDKNGEGEEDDVASAIIYAVKSGAKVINMSFGDKIYSEVLKDVIEYAYSQNVVLVGSAGNSASDLPHYPSGFNEVICVGAIQENEALAGFSNYGSTVDLVAPGSQIISTTLDGKYQKVNGTSVATPFVSAAAAMCVLQNKKYTNEQIKQILKSTAKDLGEPGWDIKFGAGKLNIFKSLQLNAPAEIKINFPLQDYFVTNDTMQINISALSPYFKSFELSYGTGFNPTEWKILNTGKESVQLYKENVYTLNVQNFVDTVYTLRLLVNNINGTTTEERVNFYADRTKPVVEFATIFPVILNDIKTFAASVSSDDITIVQLFYKSKTATEYDSLYLDGLANDVKFNRKNHFGYIPANLISENSEYEFFIKLKNRAGLETIYKDENNNAFTLNNYFRKNLIAVNKKKYNLPNGRIYRAPVLLNTHPGNFVLINENESASDASLFKKQAEEFVKLTSIKNRIPVSVGDFNNDGKTDILSLFVKKGFIDTQVKKDSSNFINVFKDTTGAFWPSFADDIDNDGKTEVIVFSSDTTITVWEVDKDFNLRKEKVLNNFAAKISDKIKSSTFRNNQILVDDFNKDGNKEIVTVDNFGRIISFVVTGANEYRNGNVWEHYFPIEAKSVIAKGDFNGDGTKDIGILMEFEDDVFITPVKYCNIISLSHNNVKSLFSNMFLDFSSGFVSAYDKKYNSIAFADLTNSNKEEVVINSFPNLYVFNYVDSNNVNLIYYKPDINAQSIFIGDLDDNGFKDISVTDIASEKILFIDFNLNEITPPVVKEFYSPDSTKNYISWETSTFPVKIFSGNTKDNLLLTDSITGNFYIHNSQNLTTTYYSLAFYNQQNGELISSLSKTFSIYTHAPAEAENAKVLSNKNLEIIFDKNIKRESINLNDFFIDSTLTPHSFEIASQKSIVLNMQNALSAGKHFVIISGLRDKFNSPVLTKTLYFNVNKVEQNAQKLYITSYKITDNYTLRINFNFKLDTLSAINKENYIISPNNPVESVKFYKNSGSSIELKTGKPFGSIGLEYTLEVKNLTSTKETGSLKLDENVGNKVVLVTSAANISEAYIYPNPVIHANTEHATFANLTPNAEVYIYDFNGRFIKKLVEEDSNGGITWDLKDNKDRIIPTGIYFYKIIAYDNSGNSVQEKIGKFAFIK